MPIDPHTRSVALIDSMEPEFARGFAALVLSIVRALSLDELEALILEGGLLAAADTWPSRVSVLADLIEGGFITSGQSTSTSISRLIDVPTSFNQSAFGAVGFMQDDRARIVGNFLQGQDYATRRAVGASIVASQTARQQAVAYRRSIGLTERQVVTLEKFRLNLDNLSAEVLGRELRDRRFDTTVRNALSTDSPLTTTQINRMVEGYRKNLLTFRAGAIAQSEALRVVNAGNLEAFEQAVAADLFRSDQISREWRTAGDDGRRRSSHAPMEGQTRGLREAFISGAGVRLMFPGDPSAGARETAGCRCTIETQISTGDDE